MHHKILGKETQHCKILCCRKVLSSVPGHHIKPEKLVLRLNFASVMCTQNRKIIKSHFIVLGAKKKDSACLTSNCFLTFKKIFKKYIKVVPASSTMYLVRSTNCMVSQSREGWNLLLSMLSSLTLFPPLQLQYPLEMLERCSVRILSLVSFLKI